MKHLKWFSCLYRVTSESFISHRMLSVFPEEEWAKFDIYLFVANIKCEHFDTFKTSAYKYWNDLNLLK